MESIFSPCTRLHDILESQGDLDDFRGHNPDVLHELNLDVSTEEFLSAENAFTYEDLYAMLENRNTIAWLTPHAGIAREDGRAEEAWLQLDDTCCFCFSTDGKRVFALARSSAALLEICDIVVRVLAVSVVHRLILSNARSHDGALINAPTLAYLMEQCQSLKALILEKITLDEDSIRVLGNFPNPGLEIELNRCRIAGAEASALAEVLGRNQGPTKLDCCYIDNSVLANGLRGNSRLKSLTPRCCDSCEVADRQVLAIAGALKENRGLVDLDLSDGFVVNDESWGVICDSAETHPTLEVLDFRFMGWMPALAPAVLKSRIQALVDVMKVNMSIHTIRLNDYLSHHELYRESVIPYLETNRFRPRLLAIQQTRPIMYRAKVLGRALLSARTDTNNFWMLLSGNAEVAFPSTTATTTPAASLPTPATTAATSDAAAPVAAAVTATRAASATDTSASASANFATSTAHQKRKARP
jgi:hypothetical protein